MNSILSTATTDASGHVLEDLQKNPAVRIACFIGGVLTTIAPAVVHVPHGGSGCNVRVERYAVGEFKEPYEQREGHNEDHTPTLTRVYAIAASTSVQNSSGVLALGGKPPKFSMRRA